MNAWFRFYHEWDSDPKVQSMTEAMQRRLAMLFCSRCKEETLQEQELAFHWRISVEELAETKALFIQKGFMDENWQPINWNKRQFISDSSTDRVRRFREKKSNETHETKCNDLDSVSPNSKSPIVMRLETARNVTVTPLSVSESVSVSDSGSETMLACNLFEELGIVGGNAERLIAADAIRQLAKEGGSTLTAQQYILEAGRAFIAAGGIIDRFWFTQQKYRPQAPRKTARQSERDAKRKAFMEAE